MKNTTGDTMCYHKKEHVIVDWFEWNLKTYYVAYAYNDVMRVWTTHVMDRGFKVKGKDHKIVTNLVPWIAIKGRVVKPDDRVIHKEGPGTVIRIIHTDFNGKTYVIAKLDNGRMVSAELDEFLDPNEFLNTKNQ